ncbi:hypothetical protein BV20DRAFT_975597 [Pilatotrama ljubarskyi]|nr:hypothetical protein BV20DRAFT_975597 [Pilatotrama ljubarskyi]
MSSLAPTVTVTSAVLEPHPPLRLTAMPAASSSSEAPPDAASKGHRGPIECRPKRPSRARDVTPRDLSESKHTFEMIYAFFCAVVAHKAIHEKADELHGDINPNALVILDHVAPDGTESSKGGLIYWEPPISVQTLRKIGNADRAVPPPQRRRAYVYPPNYHFV